MKKGPHIIYRQVSDRDDNVYTVESSTPEIKKRKHAYRTIQFTTHNPPNLGLQLYLRFGSVGLGPQDRGSVGLFGAAALIALMVRRRGGPGNRGNRLRPTARVAVVGGVLFFLRVFGCFLATRSGKA